MRPNFCYTKTRNNNDDSGQALRTDRAHQPGARSPTTKTLNGQKQAQSEANPVVSGRGDGMLDASLALLLGTNNAPSSRSKVRHTHGHTTESPQRVHRGWRWSVKTEVAFVEEERLKASCWTPPWPRRCGRCAPACSRSKPLESRPVTPIPSRLSVFILHTLWWWPSRRQSLGRWTVIRDLGGAKRPVVGDARRG